MDNIDIASYADDNAPYTTGNFFSGLVINKWDNPDKYFFWYISHSEVDYWKQKILNSKCEELLGI